MDKTELKKKLEETKAKLKTNSKDQHFADALISDLLSIKAQLVHEPSISYIPLSDIAETFKGDTYEINITKSGDAIYHVYGGYTIIADPRMIGLNSTIQWLLESYKNDTEMDDEDKESLDLIRSAVSFNLSAPTYAFADDELTFTIAKDIVAYLNKMQEQMLNADVPDENIDKNIEFEQAMTIAHSEE